MTYKLLVGSGYFCLALACIFPFALSPGWAVLLSSLFLVIMTGLFFVSTYYDGVTDDYLVQHWSDTVNKGEHIK